MERQKALEKLLSCILCHERFKKENKPLIMFCGHNICEECKIKHFKKVTCEICKKVFSKREIKRFQINYSILENKNIAQGEESSSQENITNIFSNVSPTICYNFVSTIINKVFKQIDEINIDDKKEEKKQDQVDIN